MNSKTTGVIGVGLMGQDMGYYDVMATELGAAHGAADAVEQLGARRHRGGRPNATVPELMPILTRGEARG